MRRLLAWLPRVLGRELRMALCLLVGAAIVPRTLVGRDATAWFDDDRDTARALADTVAAAADDPVTSERFHTGNARFDGEWAMGTHQMTALGLAQVVAAHPELTSRYLPAIEASVDRLVDDATFEFATAAWGAGPWASLDADREHGYLGYVALAMGSLRAIDPTTRHAAAHDRLVAALARRVAAHPMGIVQTYPGEAYPCDLAAIAGALAQHGHITGTDHAAELDRMRESFRAHWIDPASGYLVQSIDPKDGSPIDAPRASGTALGAYFWSFADPALAAELDATLMDRGARSLFGFGGVREYAEGHVGRGDIDSGPVVLGLSVSGTGFSLAAARRAGDRERFTAIFRTTALFGVPVADGDATRFVTGGPLGNAILLTMLTAPRA